MHTGNADISSIFDLVMMSNLHSLTHFKIKNITWKKCAYLCDTRWKQVTFPCAPRLLDIQSSFPQFSVCQPWEECWCWLLSFDPHNTRASWWGCGTVLKQRWPRRTQPSLAVSLLQICSKLKVCLCSPLGFSQPTPDPQPPAPPAMNPQPPLSPMQCGRKKTDAFPWH